MRYKLTRTWPKGESPNRPLIWEFDGRAALLKHLNEGVAWEQLGKIVIEKKEPTDD